MLHVANNWFICRLFKKLYLYIPNWEIITGQQLGRYFKMVAQEPHLPPWSSILSNLESWLYNYHLIKKTVCLMRMWIRLESSLWTLLTILWWTILSLKVVDRLLSNIFRAFLMLIALKKKSFYLLFLFWCYSITA